MQKSYKGTHGCVIDACMVFYTSPDHAFSSTETGTRKHRSNTTGAPDVPKERCTTITLCILMDGGIESRWERASSALRRPTSLSHSDALRSEKPRTPLTAPPSVDPHLPAHVHCDNRPDRVLPATTSVKLEREGKPPLAPPPPPPPAQKPVFGAAGFNKPERSAVESVPSPRTPRMKKKQLMRVLYVE